MSTLVAATDIRYGLEDGSVVTVAAGEYIKDSDLAGHDDVIEELRLVGAVVDFDEPDNVPVPPQTEDEKRLDRATKAAEIAAQQSFGPTETYPPADAETNADATVPGEDGEPPAPTATSATNVSPAGQSDGSSTENVNPPPTPGATP